MPPLPRCGSPQSPCFRGRRRAPAAVTGGWESLPRLPTAWVIFGSWLILVPSRQVRGPFSILVSHRTPRRDGHGSQKPASLLVGPARPRTSHEACPEPKRQRVV